MIKRTVDSWVVAKSVSLILAIFYFASASASYAQSSGSPINDSDSNVVMTMWPVVTGADGQQFYVNNNKQSLPLPGAGVGGPSVCIYSAPSGEQWYIDKTGTQQTLQAPQPYFGSNQPTQPSYGSYQGPYGDPNYNSGGNYYQQPPVQNNYYNESSNTGSGGGSGSGAGGALLAAAGAAAGTALGMGLASIPYGTPVYWGGGSPWYAGAGGAPVYVNRNYRQFNEWQHQNNYWRNTNNNYNNWNNHHNNWARHDFNNHNWNNNNWDHHWGQHNWPGKDHGFPPPHDRVPGRLYSSDPGAGGGEHRADGGGGEHRGERGGERRGPGGGEHRAGGGGDRRMGGGGHRAGGGAHPHGGGGHRGGGRRR